MLLLFREAQASVDGEAKGKVFKRFASVASQLINIRGVSGVTNIELEQVTPGIKLHAQA